MEIDRHVPRVVDRVLSRENLRESFILIICRKWRRYPLIGDFSLTIRLIEYIQPVNTCLNKRE